MVATEYAIVHEVSKGPFRRIKHVLRRGVHHEDRKVELFMATRKSSLAKEIKQIDNL